MLISLINEFYYSTSIGGHVGKAIYVYAYGCFQARSLSGVISHALSLLALETVSYWQVGHCG